MDITFVKVLNIIKYVQTLIQKILGGNRSTYWNQDPPIFETPLRRSKSVTLYISRY